MIYFECHLLSSLGGYSSLATDGSGTMQNSAYANLGKPFIFFDELFYWHRSMLVRETYSCILPHVI